MIAAWIGALAIGAQALALGLGVGEVWRALGRWWWALPGGGLALYIAVSVGFPPQAVRALKGKEAYLLSDALRGLVFVLATIAALSLLRRAVAHWRQRAERAERELLELQRKQGQVWE